METDQLRAVMLFVTAGIRAFSARAVLLLTLLLSFTLFAWTMYQPTWERIAAATVFAVLVFLPVIRMDAGAKKDRSIVSPEGD
jgi:hypothetical protein